MLIDRCPYQVLDFSGMNLPMWLKVIFSSLVSIAEISRDEQSNPQFPALIMPAG